MPIATCIGCGCDDLHACQDEHGACYWLTVDYDAGRGVCSCCKDHLGYCRHTCKNRTWCVKFPCHNLPRYIGNDVSSGSGTASASMM